MSEQATMDRLHAKAVERFQHKPQETTVIKSLTLPAREHLGVIKATLTFMKMADFMPVMLTNTDRTDVLLVRRKSGIDQLLDKIVEIPSRLLGALHVKQGAKRNNLSFR